MEKEPMIEQWEGRHILVAGEVGIDQYIWGNTSRISPEAPVPVVEVQSQSWKLGLAANVAQNLIALGAKTTLLSVCGQDADSSHLQELLEQAKIEDKHILTDASRPTLRKVRVIARKQHVVRVDYEKVHALDTKVAKKFREAICDQIPSVDGIIVQDYGKGIWNPDIMGFAAQARQHKKPVFVDPSRLSAPQLYRGVTLLTPNVDEAVVLAGGNGKFARIQPDNDEQLKELAAHLLQVVESDHIIVTCGAHGMIALSKDGQFRRIPTFAREVFDVTGAGDTVVAVLALAYSSGLSLSQCMQVANAAAGLVVAHIGTATVTEEQLDGELKRLRLERLIPG